MSKHSKKIAIDVDNVLSDTHGQFCKRASKKWGMTVTPNMITHAKVKGSFPEHDGDTWTLLEEVWVNWMDLPLIEERASEIVKDLMKLGHVITIATGRTERSIGYVQSWLKANKIQFDAFARIKYGETKAALDVDLLIDDDWREVFRFADGPNQVLRTGLIFDRPWNTNASLKEKVFRIRSLREITKYLR